MNCPKCNAEYNSAIPRFCTVCGEKMPVAEPQQQPESQPSAIQTSMKESAPIPSESGIPEKKNDPEPEFDIGKTAQEIKNTIKHGIYEVSEKYNTKYDVPEQLVPDVIHACKDEIPIRQYKFMRMSLPIAGYNATGLLQVTNKRIIYHALGSSILGEEYAHSEISIDDVAGISVEKTTSLNILIIIVFIFLGVPLTLLGLILGLLGASHMSIPLILTVAAAVGTVVLMRTKHYVFFHLLASLGSSICLGGLVSAIINSSLLSLFSEDSGSGFSVTLIVILWIFLSIMNILSYIYNLFKNSISVKVTSKSGSTALIDCSSEQSWLVGMSVIKPLVYMYETEETPIMEAELGAMISDIQKLGNYGLEKWSKPGR